MSVRCYDFLIIASAVGFASGGQQTGARREQKRSWTLKKFSVLLTVPFRAAPVAVHTLTFIHSGACFRLLELALCVCVLLPASLLHMALSGCGTVRNVTAHSGCSVEGCFEVTSLLFVRSSPAPIGRRKNDTPRTCDLRREVARAVRSHLPFRDRTAHTAAFFTAAAAAADWLAVSLCCLDRSLSVCLRSTHLSIHERQRSRGP